MKHVAIYIGLLTSIPLFLISRRLIKTEDAQLGRNLEALKKLSKRAYEKALRDEAIREAKEDIRIAGIYRQYGYDESGRKLKSDKKNKGMHRSKIEEEEREYHDMMMSMEDGHQEARRKKIELLNSGYLVPASPKDYQRYLDKRSIPCTHFYDYNLPDDFYVAVKDCTIPALFGADSISVIVPKGITVKREDYSCHCDLFPMNNPDSKRTAPSYNNANQDDMHCSKIKEKNRKFHDLISSMKNGHQKARRY